MDAISPAIVATGTPKEVDEFLVDALWKTRFGILPTSLVVEWAALLHQRGEEFASHASTCHYWLYDRLGAFPHLGPPRGAKQAIP